MLGSIHILFDQYPSQGQIWQPFGSYFLHKIYNKLHDSHFRRMHLPCVKLIASNYDFN